MANNKTTTAAQQDKLDELVVDARFIMHSFKRKDGSETKYARLDLISPFPGESLENVELKAKWDKFDDYNRLVRPDRVFGYMKYYAEKALRIASEIPVKVTIKPVTYKSNRLGVMVTYPAMFVAPTFAELEDERPVEVLVRDVSERNIFELLASKALGIKTTTREPADDYEDIGLGDNS